MIKVGDKIKIGKYNCMVTFFMYGYYLDIDVASNDNIYKQFGFKQSDFVDMVGNVKSIGTLHEFPYCETLQHLNKIINYITRDEKINYLLE